MVIYIEQILIDNFIINFLIIFCASIILKIKFNKILIGLSSLIGAVFALFSPLINFPSAFLFLIKIVLSLFMVSILKKYKKFKEFILIYLTFILLTMLFGGACLFLLTSFDKNFNLNNYTTYSLPLGLIVIIIFFIMIIIKNIFKNVYRRKSVNNFIYNIILFNNEKYFKLTAFLDSGNLLKDPLTKKPITIVDYNVIKGFINISITDILLNKVENLSKTLKNAHLVEISSVNSTKKLIVFEIDKLEIVLENSSNKIENACIGLSIKSFINDLGYNALISGEILNI